MFKLGKGKPLNDIDPDQIFLDSSNLPSFDNDLFEGRIARPISKQAIIFLGGCFVLVSIIFLVKAWLLQVVSGEYFANRSEMNSLKKIPAFSPRGIVYDRNNVQVAWNEGQGRAYLSEAGLAHVIGYVGFPTKEEADLFSDTTLNDLVGKDGVEKRFNNLLKGVPGKKIVEVDARGNVRSEYLYEPGVPGGNLILSVDSRVTKKLFESIKALAIEHNFQAGAGVIMDVKTGEILAMTSFPEYESGVLSAGDDKKKIQGYISNSGRPFLNRAISGLYLPGSIVKPIFALAALNEGIITPEKKIYSKGYISVPNPFVPGKDSIFKDWKAHGFVDMTRALAISSDVYFYAIGGGYEDQKGLGIKKLRDYAKMFGLEDVTHVELDKEARGNIPSPEWKAENFSNDRWRIGDTYISSIGQYGFLVTPIQMVKVAAAFATDGKLFKPTIFLKILPHDGEYLSLDFSEYEELNISKEFFRVVKDGMRRGVIDSDGTARALNIPEVSVAAKTGTAELGITKKLVNSWGIGFFPYENPRFAFAVVMEKGSRESNIGANLAIRNLLIWMSENTPEYLR